uniref:CSON006311 protein n=1 Tax=Culicoides sonorensis TaxID=179676 RepID=A0A336L925_CULSO
MQSNIFAAPEPVNKTGDKSRRVASTDSYNRLFGDANRPQTPAKNHMKSNIPIGNGTNGTNGTNGVDSVDTNGHAATNGKSNGHTNGYSNGTNGTNGVHHETNGKVHMNGNGVAHTNGHSETGISKSHNDEKTPDSAYGTKSSGSNANIHFTFSQHHDEIASSTNSTNTTSSMMSASSPRSPRYVQRNPVTGSAANGNPVTGEGYMKPAQAEINTQVPALNGSRDHVINKNRIPPGGFSSQLW